MPVPVVGQPVTTARTRATAVVSQATSPRPEQRPALKTNRLATVARNEVHGARIVTSGMGTERPRGCTCQMTMTTTTTHTRSPTVLCTSQAWTTVGAETTTEAGRLQTVPAPGGSVRCNRAIARCSEVGTLAITFAKRHGLLMNAGAAMTSQPECMKHRGPTRTARPSHHHHHHHDAGVPPRRNHNCLRRENFCGVASSKSSSSSRGRATTTTDSSGSSRTSTTNPIRRSVTITGARGVLNEKVLRHHGRSEVLPVLYCFGCAS